MSFSYVLSFYQGAGNHIVDLSSKTCMLPKLKLSLTATYLTGQADKIKSFLLIISCGWL